MRGRKWQEGNGAAKSPLIVVTRLGAPDIAIRDIEHETVKLGPSACNYHLPGNGVLLTTYGMSKVVPSMAVNQTMSLLGTKP